MILKSIEYYDEYWGWSIRGGNRSPLELNQINLIVGQNATGKTKTLEAIRYIADLLSGRIILSRDFYDSENYRFTYILNFINANEDEIYYGVELLKSVQAEILKVNGIEKLNRNKQKLFYEKEGKYLSSKFRSNQLAVTKGDSEQQPFFDELYNWSYRVAHYKFGSEMGRHKPERYESVGFYPLSDELIDKVMSAQKKAFPKVIDDMNEIGYNISDLKLNENGIYKFLETFEKDINRIIGHPQMSDGMFRALSLIIQLNYSLLSDQPSLILIDDIGEGLDYERSKKLIDLIIKKVEGTQVQLIMTTNDRFVMNKVPLKYWQVIKREKNKSVFYNYENSKQNFDDFALVGLSNFDFFTTEFFVKGFEEYVKVNP